MNLNNVLFFNAYANYFEVCMDLIKSLRHARTEIPRMRIFDVGLHPQQSEILRKHVEVIIEPGWDLGQHESYPQWFRAHDFATLPSKVCLEFGNHCLA